MPIENKPTELEIHSFLNTYKSQQEKKIYKQNTESKISFTDDQQQILNLLDTQITSIQNGTMTANSIKRVIIQGKAGSGKSTIIKEMVKRITSIFGEDSVKVAASTGMASVNIDGLTLHYLLRLPVNYKLFSKLENQNAKKFQTDLKDLKFLIIDEMSLIGLRTLFQIESRCREIHANEIDEPFGGIIIYLLGDYNQLTPVGDTAVFSDKKLTDNLQTQGRIIFKQFQKYYCLQNAHRQKGNHTPYSQLLDEIANAELSQQNYN